MKLPIAKEAKKIPKGLSDIPPDEEDDDMTASGYSKKDAAKLRKKSKKEDTDKSEPGTQGDDKEYAKKRDAVLKKFGVVTYL